MARPICEIERSTVSAEEAQAGALAELLQSVSENREAIMDMLYIIGHLKDMGVLAAVKGLLDQRHEVGLIAVQQLTNPKMYHMLKNVWTGVQAVGSLPPDTLEKMVNGLSHGFEESIEVEANDSPPSLWDLFKSMRDPAIRTSFATMLGVMHGMGESLKNDTSKLKH